MLSVRCFSRALPKASALRYVRSTPRTMSMLHRSTTNPSLTRSASPLTQTLRVSTSPLRKAFSTSVPLMQEDVSEGSTDQELAATLASELQLERENSGTEELPAELQEFLTASEFQIADQAGEEEVVLTKQFGNETIRITFSVSDLSTEHDPDAFLQDRALEDEPFDESDLDGSASAKKNINVGSTKSFASAPEDAVADADRAASGGSGDPEVDGASMDPDASFPVNMNITITKAGQSGAMHFGVVADDGAVAIERAHFFANAQHADAQTADQQWSARNVYTGPPFSNLDEGLQEVMERYLEERGVNTTLAVWVPEYIEWKEQREYMRWLENAKNFIEA